MNWLIVARLQNLCSLGSLYVPSLSVKINFKRLSDELETGLSEISVFPVSIAVSTSSSVVWLWFESILEYPQIIKYITHYYNRTLI